MTVICEAINCEKPAEHFNFYEQSHLCTPCDSIWNDAPKTVPELVKGMKAKFERIMQEHFKLANDVFRSPITHIEYSYSEAFQFWCASKMELTPPPF